MIISKIVLIKTNKTEKKTLKSETKVFLLSGSGRIIFVSMSVVCHPLFQPQGPALGADTFANL